MAKLSIHTLMHVPFEGLGCIEQWINSNNHSVSYTKLYEDNQFPEITEIDWLIVMGGPMGVYDENIYPWLTGEKIFIKEAIAAGKTVIGICLGSQLIAEVLGARVYPNTQKEIGWFNLKTSPENMKNPLLRGFENQFPAFHWHGDTFDLPEGSKRLFYSDITPNQAFLYKEKVLGLQFHYEVTRESMTEMVKHGAAELVKSETIQSAKEILAQTNYIQANNLKMFSLLDYLAK
jgi:GMP synthase-like glutamine amidotransferase